MAVHTKTRRRLRLLAIAFLTFVIAGAAFYLIRQRQIRTRILAGRDTGYAALESGDYFNALHKIGPYLRRHPQDTEALSKYAKARQNVPEPNSKHIADALSLYRRLLELDPAHEEGRRTLLDLYVQYGLNTEILEITRDRTDAPSRHARVIALARMGRLNEALPLAKENAAADPLSLDRQVVVLDLLRQSGTPAAQILEHARQLHQQHPDDARFELLLSLAHTHNQESDRALELARRAAARPLEDPKLVNALVNQLDALGSFGEARALLDKAALRPDGEQFRIEATRRLLNAGEYQEVARRLGGLDPLDTAAPAELLALRAIAHVRLQQREPATAIMNALAQRENDVVAAAWAAVMPVVFVEGKPRDVSVIAACTSAIQKAPDNPYFRFYLGQAYVRAGDDAAAVREFVAACQLARSWAAPLNALARAMLASGQPRAALEVAQAARDRAPADPDVLVTLAMSNVATTSPEDATAVNQIFELLDEVQKTAPDHNGARVLRVAMLAQLDRKPEAVKLLETYLNAQAAPDAETLLELAALSRTNELGLQQRCYDVYEAKYGVTPDLALARAILARSDGDAPRGRQLLDEARQRAKPGDELDWRLAQARYLETIRDERARQEWITLAAADPEDPVVQRLALKAASVRTERQFLRQTIDRLGTIIGPEGIEWRLADAQWLMAGNAGEQEIAKATVLLNDLVRRAPEHIQARRMLAECLVRLSKPNDAIEQLFLASRLDPQSNQVLLRLASLLHETGQFDRATSVISQIRQNLARPTRDASAVDEERRSLAGLLSERGQTDEAIALLQQQGTSAQLAALHAQRGTLTEQMCAELLQNPEPASIGLVADFYAARRDAAEAQRILARLDELDAPPAVVFLVRARHYERHGTAEQVLEQLTAATQAAPQDPSPWRSLIAHHMLRGEAEPATRAVEQAHKALPANVEFARCWKHADLIKPLLEHEPARPLAIHLLNPTQDHGVILEALEIIAGAVKDSGSTISEVIPRLMPLAQRAPRLLALQQLLAAMHLAAGQAEEALAVATAAMQAFPNEPEPARLTAQSLAVLGRWDQVRPIAQQWKRRAPSAAAQADILIAAAQLASGDAADALATLEPHLDAALKDPSAGEDLLRLYLQSSLLVNRADHAAATVEPALSNSSGLRSAWAQLAGQAIADTATAEAWLQKVEPLIDPASVGERMMLAQAWMMLAQRSNQPSHQTRAIESLERASRGLETASRESPREWEGMGMLYDAAGKAELAEECYRKALQLNADMPIAQNNLAMLVVTRKGDLTEAMTLATKAAAHRDHPLCASFLDTLAIVQTRLQRHEDAAKSLNDAIARDPRNVQWRVNLVQVLLDDGKVGAAKAAFRELDMLAPDTARVPESVRQRVQQLRSELSSRESANSKR